MKKIGKGLRRNWNSYGTRSPVGVSIHPDAQRSLCPRYNGVHWSNVGTNNAWTRPPPCKLKCAREISNGYIPRKISQEFFLREIYIDCDAQNGDSKQKGREKKEGQKVERRFSSAINNFFYTRLVKLDISNSPCYFVQQTAGNRRWICCVAWFNEWQCREAAFQNT